MLSKRLLAGIRLATLIILLLIALILLINSIIKNATIQDYLLARVSEATGYKIEARKVDFSLWGRLEVQAYDLVVGSPSGKVILHAPIVRACFDWAEVTKGRYVPEKVFLSRPLIRVSDDVSKKGIPGHRDKPPEEVLIQNLGMLPQISISGGGVVAEGSSYSLEDIFFESSQGQEEETKLEVMLRGYINKGEQSSYLVTRGIISSKREKGVLGEIRVGLEDFPLSWLSKEESVPVKNGRARARFLLNGSLEEGVTISGKVFAEELDFSIVRGERAKDYCLPYLAVDLDGFYWERNLHISNMRLEGPDFTLSGSYNLNFEDPSKPEMSLRASSPLTKLETFKKIFPIPLVPNWVETRLSPAMESGEIRLENMEMQGRLSDITSIGEPESKEAFSISLSWREVKLAMAEGALPFDQVSGRLRIAGGRLLLEGITGAFGKSFVRDGALEVEGLYGDMPLYHALVDGSFSVQDLVRQRETGLLPVSIRKMLGRVAPASGKLEARARVSYSKGQKYPSVVEGTFVFRDCTVSQEALFFPVKLDELRLSIGEGKGASFEGRGMWGNVYFRADGYVEKTWDKGKAEVQAEANLSEVSAVFPKKALQSLNLNGFASSQFQVSWSGDSLSCKGEIDLDRLVISAPLFGLDPLGDREGIEFTVRFESGKRVEFKDCRLYIGESVLNFTGSYDLSEREKLDLTLSSQGLRLRDLGIAIEEEKIQAGGVIRTQAKIELLLNNPLESRVFGKADGRDIRLESGGLPYSIKNGGFDVEFSDAQAIIHRLGVQIGDSLFAAEGKLRGWEGPDGMLEVEAEYLDISDFLPQEDRNPEGDGDADEGGMLSKTNIGLKVNVAKGRYRGVRFGPARADCAFSGGAFHVLDSQIVLDHGNVDLKGRVEVGRSKKKSLDAVFILEDQPFEELHRALGLGKADLDGSLDLKGNIRMRGSKREDLLSSMGGRVEIHLKEGKIERSNIILKVLEFLNLQYIFKKTPDDLSEEGFYYESITGEGKIERGVIHTEALIMKSPVFNSVSKGDVDLVNGLIDIHLGVQPLVSIDALLSRIPVAGYILTGENKSILVYHFKVDGPLSEPRVRYVPFKNLAPSVLDFFKRLFLQSGRVLLWPLQGDVK